MGTNPGMNPDQVALFDGYFRELQKVPCYIGSAFRSLRTNEVYFLFEETYVQLFFTPGQQIDDKSYGFWRTESNAISGFYRFLWNLFYAEYAIFPFI
ncbi:hypothetical protein VNO80_14161 [Phaseolus coccineus]|uniref:Uncharacterized protein n=1 Tax=Phaseolus coccineus TaxID=3886 RepID=A0AAN9R1M0_PHACN